MYLIIALIVGLTNAENLCETTIDRDIEQMTFYDSNCTAILLRTGPYLNSFDLKDGVWYKVLERELESGNEVFVSFTESCSNNITLNKTILKCASNISEQCLGNDTCKIINLIKYSECFFKYCDFKSDTLASYEDTDILSSIPDISLDTSSSEIYFEEYTDINSNYTNNYGLDKLSIIFELLGMPLHQLQQLLNTSNSKYNNNTEIKLVNVSTDIYCCHDDKSDNITISVYQKNIITYIWEIFVIIIFPLLMFLALYITIFFIFD